MIRMTRGSYFIISRVYDFTTDTELSNFNYSDQELRYLLSLKARLEVPAV